MQHTGSVNPVGQRVGPSAGAAKAHLHVPDFCGSIFAVAETLKQLKLKFNCFNVHTGANDSVFKSIFQRSEKWSW